MIITDPLPQVTTLLVITLGVTRVILTHTPMRDTLQVITGITEAVITIEIKTTITDIGILTKF